MWNLKIAITVCNRHFQCALIPQEKAWKSDAYCYDVRHFFWEGQSGQLSLVRKSEILKSFEVNMNQFIWKFWTVSLLRIRKKLHNGSAQDWVWVLFFCLFLLTTKYLQFFIYFSLAPLHAVIVYTICLLAMLISLILPYAFRKSEYAYTNLHRVLSARGFMITMSLCGVFHLLQHSVSFSYWELQNML